MRKTLFLYLDILGFRGLVKEPEQISWLYKVIDAARIHKDSNYRTIVFSDTLLAYNSQTPTYGNQKAAELMFLIELVQEFSHRLAGSGIFFRALITEGEFTHDKLQNIEAYYGPALVDTYDAEKSLVGVGLFLDKKIDRFNLVFRSREFSPEFDFVYTLLDLTRLGEYTEGNGSGPLKLGPAILPLPAELVTEASIEYRVLCEIKQLQEIHTGMTQHPLPAVRAKFLATWKMYELQLPNLTRALADSGFDPRALLDLDWSTFTSDFEKNHRKKATEQPGIAEQGEDANAGHAAG